MARGIFPMFSPRNFMVSSITSKSSIHFELIFVRGVDQRSNFFLLHVHIQFSHHHLLKKLPFSIEYLCLPCQIVERICIVYFWALNSVSFFYMSVFMPVPQCFDYYSFVTQLEIRKCDASHFVLPFQDGFGYLGLLLFHINYRIFFTLIKDVIGILIGIALNLQMAFGSIDIVTIYISQFRDTG